MSRAASTGGAVVALAWLAQVVLALLLTVVLGRGLDAAGFGLFALVAAALGVARETADLGSTVAAARTMRTRPADEGPLLLGLALLRSGTALLGAAAALLLALRADDGALRGVALATAAALLLLPCGAVQALFVARGRQLAPALWGAGTQAAVLLLALALLAQAAPAWAMALAVIAREAAWLLGLLLLGLPLWRRGPSPPGASAALRLALAAVGPWAGVVVLRQLWGQVELVVVTLLHGTAEAGAWSAAARLLAPAAALTVALAAPLVPALAAAAPAAAAGLAGAALAWVAGVSLLLAAAGWVLAGDLVALVYDGAWGGAGGRVADALAWMAAALVPTVLSLVAGLVLLAAHRERQVAVALLLALVLKLLACALWVPEGGALVAARIAAATEGVLAIVLIVAARRAFPPMPAAPRVEPALRGPALAAMAAAAWALPVLVALPPWPSPGVRIGAVALAVAAGLGWAWWGAPGRALRRAWQAAAVAHPEIEGHPAKPAH